jgi:hypothetical protein
VPLFCLMAIYCHNSWPVRRRLLKPVFVSGLIFGLFAVVLLHDTNLVGKIFNRTLPAQIDPLRRVRSWNETAQAVEQAREKLAAEGKPVFIIGDHYGITGQLSFYLPEAKKQIQNNPIVYFRSTPRPKNQFYFWPGYENRQGQNAVYVQQIKPPKLEHGWFWKWLAGKKNLNAATTYTPETPPREIMEQFTSVTDLGITEISYRKRIFRRVQIFECRDLRDEPQ